MDSISILQFLGAFLAVILAIILLGVFLRRAPFLQALQQRKSARGALELRDSLFIDPRSKCVVVGWKEREYLLFISPNQVRVIADTATHDKTNNE